MRSASLAEWIIARFTTKDRAACIIGDLLEAVPEKGKLWFWVSVAGVFFSLTWRHALALAGAFYLFSYPRVSGHALMLSASEMEIEIVVRQTLKTLFYAYLFSLGFQLRLGVFYMAIRYGLKDMFVRYILAAWVLVAILNRYFYKSPQIVIACVGLASCAVVYSAVSAQRRKGLLALACVIAILFAWYEFSGPMDLILFRAMLLVAPSHTSLAASLMALLVQTFVFARVHYLFFEKNSRSSKSEPPDNAQLSVDIS
jgi:hypothetical protein